MRLTRIITGVMVVSVALVLLSALLNLVDVVAITSAVVGKQDNGWSGLLAMLLAIAALAIFVYASRRSIWNWIVRGALFALSGIIFVIALVRMADSLVMKLGGGRNFTWSEGSPLSPDVYKVVHDTFTVIDLDFVVVMMLLGSIGIAAAALWGALKWESAKDQEIKDEEIKRIPDDALAKLLQEELGRPPGWTRTAPEVPNPSASGTQTVSTPTDPTPINQPPAPPPLQSAPIPPAQDRRRRCPRCWSELEPGASSCAVCGASR